ncbi:MAG: 4Fe-4S binding protein [candidate division WOR-3 bacterium]
MKKPKLRELGEAIRAIVQGPYTAKFPYAPSIPPETYRGIIIFVEDRCICCGACVEVCPANAREMVDDLAKGVRRNIHHQETCIYCGQCVRYCPTEAIKHTQEYDLAKLKREGYENFIEKELTYCEICHKPFATKAQLLWLAKKLGEMAFANPTLYLTLYEDLGLIEPPSADRALLQAAPYRSDSVRVLCPDCRRRTYLNEIWGY